MLTNTVIEDLRRMGHDVECPVTGTVIVDGFIYPPDIWDRMAGRGAKYVADHTARLIAEERERREWEAMAPELERLGDEFCAMFGYTYLSISRKQLGYYDPTRSANMTLPWDSVRKWMQDNTPG